jgi:hypothetical protein
MAGRIGKGALFETRHSQKHEKSQRNSWGCVFSSLTSSPIDRAFLLAMHHELFL